jgi:vancomycin resistance protein VanJ
MSPSPPALANAALPPRSALPVDARTDSTEPRARAELVALMRVRAAVGSDAPADSAPADRESSRSRTGWASRASWVWWAVLLGAWCAGPLGLAWAWPFTLPANLLLWLVPATLPLALAWAWVGRSGLALALVAHAPVWAVVCSPELGSAPPVAAAVEARGPEWSVLSFNVGDFRTPPADVVRAVLASDADLIALQELSLEQARAVAVECSERYPHQALYPHGPEGRGLLSRTPLSEVRFEQGPAHRRQLFARVAVGAGHVEVAAVHLSVLAAIRGAGEASAAHLLAWAAEPSEHPRVLLGDFNSTSTSGVSHGLRAAGLVDAFESRGRGAGFTFPVAGRYNGVPLPPFLRLDQAWCSADCQVLEARVAADGGGDHLPLAVRLRLP